MNNIPTAEEFLEQNNTEVTFHRARILKEFAQLHVKAALEAAAENYWLKYYMSSLYDHDGKIDKVKSFEELEHIKKSILNAYPLTNIR